MKRRAVYFLLCVCFCFSSLSLSSSAVNQDILDEGWLYDSSEDVYYKYPYMEMQLPSFMLALEPNFPSFDPNNIPWIEAPSYVQDIIYSELPNLNTENYLSNIPFVCIVRNASLIRVFVGYNLCLGRLYQYDSSTKTFSRGNFGVFSFANLGSSAYSVCYAADYNVDCSIRVPWRVIEPVDFGTTGHCKQYSGISVAQTHSIDMYCYGANYGKEGNVASFSVKATDTANYHNVVVVQNLSGFSSGRFVGYQDEFDNAYFQSFSPKTIEQVEAETSKGIWDSIKSIPDMIGEKLKGLFIPAEGFFSSYVAEYQNYFSERFGLVYEIPESVIGIMQQFISYTPAESGYSIHFPEVVMPVLDNGEWYDAVIIEEQDITFDFLEQGAFKTLYTMYRSVLWLTYIFLLINMIIRKSERVFGGGG